MSPRIVTLSSVFDLEDLTRRARGLVRPDRRALLGIAGAPGAGKSTLAAELAAALGAEMAVVVPMDGFHRSSAELEAMGAADRKGAPDTFDALGYAELLARLRAPGEVRAPAFDRAREQTVADAITVGADVALVITEGNYLLLAEQPWAAVRPLLDEVWMVESDGAVRRERLIARHMRHGREAAAARAWVEAVDEPNARLVEASGGRADLVLFGE